MLLHQRLHTVDEFWELCQRPDYANQHLEFLGIHDTLQGEDVLPGFTLLLSDLFGTK
jgi:hypothetical protein